MRILFALAALPLLTTFAPYVLYKEPVLPRHPAVRFLPVSLDESDPARRRLGGLIFLEGWAIESNDPRFGGISAIRVDGDEVLAVSDAGSLIRLTLPANGSAQITIHTLSEGPGLASSKFDRDVEAMTAHGGHAWLAFEGRNAIWRYNRDDWSSDAGFEPPAMQDWPGNDGGEAMLRQADGSFLIFSEGKGRPDGSTEALLFEGDPAVAGTSTATLGYRAPDGYRITDAARLPDGRILYLNRRASILEGFSARLTVGRGGEFEAGEILAGREIARFDAPITVDNFEAMSIGQEDGRTVVWLASDDNFSALQRTLLLKFALAE